jgi:hypothetical protein
MVLKKMNGNDSWSTNGQQNAQQTLKYVSLPSECSLKRFLKMKIIEN